MEIVAWNRLLSFVIPAKAGIHCYTPYSEDSYRIADFSLTLTTSSVNEGIDTVLLRDFWPCWISTSEGATPSALAKTRNTSWLAFLSSGGELTATCHTPDKYPTIALRLDLGLTRIWMVDMSVGPGTSNEFIRPI